MEATLQSNVADFQASFQRYLGYTRKSPDAALEKKGKSINVTAQQLFRQHQWGGLPRDKGIAKREFAARVAQGKGILVRGSLLAQYAAQKIALKGKDATELWRSIVGKELAARSSSIGFLQASLLAYKKRQSGDTGIVYSVSRSGRGIGYVDKEVNGDESSLTIASLADGSGDVDQKYSIIAQALADETADMDAFMQAQDDANKAAAGLN